MKMKWMKKLCVLGLMLICVGCGTEEKPLTVIAQESLQKSEVTEDGIPLASSTWTELRVEGKNADAVNAVLIEEEAKAIDITELLAAAKEEIIWRAETVEGLQYWEGLYQSYRVAPTRSDAKIFSVSQLGENYWGGAHGYAWVEGLTFDVQTGKRLTLTDLAQEGKDLPAFCIDWITEELQHPPVDMEYWENAAEYVPDLVNGDNWYLEEEGLTFVSPLYLLCCYAAGMPSFTIPYENLREIVQVDYIP